MILKSDLSKAKIGDKVFSTSHGWGTIEHILENACYPIIAVFEFERHVFTLDGKANSLNVFPTLFTYNPFESKTFEPRWMMVSTYGMIWVKRFVIYKTSSSFIALYNAENEEQIKNETSTASWTYATEIEEIEFSMEEALEELAKLKGIDKSLIKIKI
ncbi:MAG: hypothetical protein RI943_1239 [Bacteroidota bacterium]|jgi:hypothetical protein